MSIKIGIGRTQIFTGGGGGGGSALLPGEIAIRAGGTAAWFDYSDASTLTDDGGGVISSWRDKLLSGNNINAVLTARPTITANGMLFDGVGNFMYSAAIAALVQPTFLYIVVQAVTFTHGDFVCDGLSFLTGAVRFVDNNIRVVANAGSYSPNNDNWTTGDWHIIRCLFNGANSKLIVDETAPITGNFGAGNMGGIMLGCYQYGNYAHILVKDFIARTVNETAGDEANIYAYLKSKNGL